MQDMTKENCKGRVIGSGLRVYPETPQAYHLIRDFISKENMESFTHQLQEEKELKAVIRGMPSDMPPQEIIEGLLNIKKTIAPTTNTQPGTSNTSTQSSNPQPVNPRPQIQHEPLTSNEVTQEETSASNLSQASSLADTIRQLQDPQVVSLMSTLRKIVSIAKSPKSEGEKVIDLCTLLGINLE
ncbi:hypothetical protein TNCT_510571 [Trichonephila clavata]|uniref:Uncharacterized protein n=1 Tax=Trichonephila clavata TaxID=2740835 RepID=A0A8X6GKW8_TRICU|nr:hypothetical protein TNCT_510571 [Trichonephila clavata]